MTQSGDQSRTLTFEEHHHREDSLERLEHWYKLSENPLYAWEAINYCLADESPRSIPDWCLQYLGKAASNMFLLSRLADFSSENPNGGELTIEQAHRRVNEALGISKQGKHNAFQRLEKDCEDCRDALAVDRGGKSVMDKLQASRNVEADRQHRIIRRGRKLLRVKRAKPTG